MDSGLEKDLTMAFVDSTDSILKWENEDNTTPLSTKMNMHLDSVGLVTNKLERQGVFRVATIPARTALVTKIGASNISVSNPLFVVRANASAGQRLEYTENGSTWHYVKTSQEVDDTGWKTTGISIGFSSGWSLDSYSLRILNGILYGIVVTTRTGANLVPNSAGNFGDSPAFTMPVGYRITNSIPNFVDIQNSGVASAFGRAETSGLVVCTHGIPGVQIISGTSYRYELNYPVI